MQETFRCVSSLPKKGNPMHPELHPITTPITLPQPFDPDADLHDDPFVQLKQSFGMYSGNEMAAIGRQLPADNHLVEGLIPQRSVNLLVGDSGIGKSPMAYQIALAVAGGVPFLSLPVRTGKVVVADYEN